ncbi:hypothetical protein CPB86DRAFT_791675 [Serendipita vermifera]|nr:hypothetical protein CPB86DRAFT_791675 [Serendipita vermifera]
MASASTTTSHPSEFHPASAAVHLVACSIIAFCFARRFTWKHLTLNRLCVLAIFLDSWVFIFWGGLVATGIGMSRNPKVCLTGIYLCVSFYGSSKVLTYIFLSDRVCLLSQLYNLLLPSLFLFLSDLSIPVYFSMQSRLEPDHVDPFNLTTFCIVISQSRYAHISSLNRFISFGVRITQRALANRISTWHAST